MKIACSKYSEIDHQIIEEMTNLGFPLIGGTALEIYANHYGVKSPRPRSNNDIDAVAVNSSNAAYLAAQLNEKFPQIREKGIKIDCYINSNAVSSAIEVDGVLCSSLAWIYWSKLGRFEEKDKNDLLWIESLPIDLDALADEVELYGVTEEMAENAQSLR